MTEFSPWQKLIAENYGGGDYAHVEKLDGCRDVGDTLFAFLMIETDPKEGCTDWIEAGRRVAAARREIEELEKLFTMHAPYLTERGKRESEA